MKLPDGWSRRVRYPDFWIFLSSGVFLFLFILAEWSGRFHESSAPSALYRVLLPVLICALSYLGGLLCVGRTGNSRHMRLLFLLFFLFYLYMILTLTLVDESLGRGTNSIFRQEDNPREYYLENFVNFRPFRSIWQVYVKGWLNGLVSFRYVVLNLLGNLCAFMPFSLFLPLLFRRQNKWYVFLPTVTLTVAAVETAQFLLMAGACDIDDLILNVGGAVILFFVLKIPPVRHFVDFAVSGGRPDQTQK